MSQSIYTEANEFIEVELDKRLDRIRTVFNSAAICIYGPMMFEADSVFRRLVEYTKKRHPDQDSLTVIITSEGGYIEVVHRMVDTMRQHYKHVNFVVPDAAYSAGTVLVMSGDAIFMNYYSRLGPIDPQVSTASGQPVPALGYLVQYERLLKRAKEGKITTPEMMLMVEKFDQAELYKYEQSRELSIALLKEWLIKYKFKDWTKTETRKLPVTEQMKKLRATTIARQLNNTEKWHTHGHGISAEVLRQDLKLKIDNFSADPVMGEAITDYHVLLDDYMVKRMHVGVMHALGRYMVYFRHFHTGDEE